MSRKFQTEIQPNESNCSNAGNWLDILAIRVSWGFASSQTIAPRCKPTGFFTVKFNENCYFLGKPNIP